MSIITRINVLLVASIFLLSANVQAQPCKDCKPSTQTEKAQKAKPKKEKNKSTGQSSSSGPYDTIRICKPGPGCPP